MDTARVFVWRIRLCLLAMALGLIGVGADKPAPVAQSIQRNQPGPTVQTLATLSTKAAPMHVGSGPVPRSLSEPVKRVRTTTVAPRSLDLRCSGQSAKSPHSLLAARKSVRAQNSSGCKPAVSASTNIKTSIKSAVSGQRKPAATLSKKRDTSVGATRNAESPKARHKVARKDDAKSARNVAAVRQARSRNA
jgi:hypothetical protein